MGGTGCPRRTSARGNRWVARELAWDAYLLRSASRYEEVVRSPHDHAGRLLPVRHGRQPRLPQLAALPAANDLRRPGADTRRAALHDRPATAAAHTRAAESLRNRAAVHALRPRQLERPRLLAAARGGRVRPRHARHVVLRRAAALCRHRPDRDGVGAHQGGLRPSGEPARTARRLRDGEHRRLERLLDRARAADRIDAGDRPDGLRLPQARRARRPARRQRIRRPAASRRRPQRRDPAQGMDRRRLVLARLQRRHPGRQGGDLRGAPAVGGARGGALGLRRPPRW